MKKTTMAVLTLFSLAACGGGGSSPTGSSPPAVAPPAATPTPAPATSGAITAHESDAFMELERTTSEKCGHYKFHLPYTISAGEVQVRDFQVIYNDKYGFEERITGDFASDWFAPQSRKFAWTARGCLFGNVLIEGSVNYITRAGETKQVTFSVANPPTTVK